MVARRQGIVAYALRFCLALPVLLWLGGPAVADVPYETEIVGAPDVVAGPLHDNAQLVKLEDRAPPSVAALRRRALDDFPNLRRIMESEGYWASHFAVSIDEAVQPVKVTLRVTAGPRYRLGLVVFKTPSGGTLPLLAGRQLDDFGLALGAPARSAAVVDAEPRILATFQDNGYPFAKIDKRQVVVDDAAHSMAVTYVVEPGPAALFGPAKITGLSRLSPSYVEHRLTWREGQPYDERKVAATRKRLVDSNLFTVARISHGDVVGPGDRVPMTITLVERLPHSVGVGAEYSTSLGFGARAFWENRNLFGNAERLRLTTDFAQSRLGASAAFRKPDVLAIDQDLLVSADLADESPPAYTTRYVRTRAGLERRLGERYTVGGSLGYDHANVSAHGTSQIYNLLAVPIYGRRDTTGNLLNPTDGSRLSLEVTPYRSIDGGGLTFVSNRLIGSLYRPVGPDDRFVLAGYARLGSIFGESRDRVPFDKRLYAGGGGSVRGYGYQKVGPRDANGQPLGGKSSLEFGAEFRAKVTENIGIVPFIDAGNVSSGQLLHLTGRLFIGAGIGVRYYTSFGPIRLDLATPVSPIRHGDSPIQVYISLGQAF